MTTRPRLGHGGRCSSWTSPAAKSLLVLILALLTLAFSAGTPAFASTRITLAAIGDVMGHTTLVDSAWSQSSGSYDFRPILAPIAPYLKAADYALANLETPLAGPAIGYSGYPTFNSPASYASALADAGVDFVGTANNHSLDKGWTGVQHTLGYLDQIGLAHAGTARSAGEQAQPFIADVKGVHVAILNYTYGTNDFPLPSGRPYAVNLLGDGSALLAQARRARAQGADLVVAFLHWGIEGQRYPSSAQTALASRLLNNGVDAIIGSHPHVVQPIARMDGKVDGQARSLYVAYSLGNFSSNQRDRYTDSGIVLYLDIQKDSAGTSVTGVRFLPVYVQKTDVTGRTQFRVLPVASGIHRGADLLLSAGEKARMDQVQQELGSLLLNLAANIDVYKAGTQAQQYAVALAGLKARGIMVGDTSGDMHADDPVTRQQFAKLIAMALDLPVSEADQCLFADVAKSGAGQLYPDHYVAVVAARDIVAGKGDGLFHPSDDSARGQVVSMVVRAVESVRPGLLTVPPSGYRSTWDAALAPTHNANAALAEYNRLLAGLPLADLDPWGPMSRGEVAQTLFNLLQALK